ncbi:hypothetical protein [Serratia liquefaciens]|uniref:hypothetical protein n=1 Tax=Serratia liquefaciens TaxID=614 RepID=UPI000E06A81B|nr:hypothetical protein [Serratia liquefaciens]SUI89597.1 Uncharacterised protein [Serratia liquefaciens]
MSEGTSLGTIYIEVDMETRKLLDANKLVNKSLDDVGKGTEKLTAKIDGADKSLGGLSKSASAVSTALKMPEINRLSIELAQLSGKIGASTDAAISGAVAQNRFSGALSTVAGQLGAGYVSNIGEATSALIRHTKEAIAATSAQLENSVAAQKEAISLQGAASQLVINAAAEKKTAEAALQTAESELQVAEAIFSRKESDIASLEALLARQKESLKQSEANLQITNSEKAVKDAIQARNAVETTQNKILKQSNQAVKEVTAAEDKARAAKVAITTASEKLSAASVLEVAAASTVEKANEAVAISSMKVTLAAKAQAAAVTGARTALALLGGPAGVLLLAAAGVYALYQAMGDNTSIDDYRAKVKEAAKALDELTANQAKAAAIQAGVVIKADSKSIEEAKQQIDDLEGKIADLQARGLTFGNYADNIKSYNNQITQLQGDIDGYSRSIAEAKGSQDKFNQAAKTNNDTSIENIRSGRILAEVRNAMTKQQDLLTEATSKGAQAAELLAFRQELENRYIQQGIVITDDIAQSIDQVVEKKRQLMADASQGAFTAQLKVIQGNVEALKIEMNQGAEAAAVYRAQLALNDAGVTDPKKAKEYTDAIREQFKLQKQIADSRKNAGGSGRVGKADKGLERQQSQAASLRREYELLTTGVSDVAREMSIFNAVQSLGTKATQQQKEAAAADAATVYDLKQKVEDFHKAAEITPELKISKAFADESEQLRRLFAEGLIDENTFREMGAKAKESFMAGMAEAKSDAVVSPMQEAVGKVDPVQALANENAKKIALINQFEQQKLAILQQSNMQGVITAQQYEQQKLSVEQQALALRNAANTQYEQARTEAQWEIWRNQSTTNDLMASAVDGFASEASSALTGLINGTQSASEAFQNLGNSILNSVIQALVEVGIQYLKNAAMAMIADKMTSTSSQQAGAQTAAAWAPAAAAASIATFGGAAIAGIAGMVAAFGIGAALAGKRKNGGGVRPGGLYEFGEGGLPEMLQMGGKNYLLPGNNGSVISNKDLMNSNGQSQIPKASNGSHQLKNSANDDSVSVKAASVVPNFTVIVENHGTPMEVMGQRYEKGLSGDDVVRVVVSDLQQGGQIRQALTKYTTASARANE